MSRPDLSFLPADHPAHSLPDAAFNRVVDHKFAPRLTEEERCAIYILHYHGTSMQRLAAAFGVNRRTVSLIVNTESPKYRSVRQKFEQLGVREFSARYLTEPVVQKLKAAADAAEAQLNNKEYQKARVATSTRPPNPNADARAGVHTLFMLPEYNGGIPGKRPNRVKIEFRCYEEGAPLSWCWSNPDAADFDPAFEWSGGFRTSAEALANAQSNIMEEE